MSYKTYCYYLLFSVGALLLLISAFNRIVDPFWYYQDVEIESFNQIKTKVERFERHVKPQILLREQPQAIILGSSFAEIGFNPENTDFNKQGQLKAYNFAFAGSGWQRTFCYFKYAVENAPIQRIVLGIHPQTALPVIDCSKQLPEINAFSQAKLLLSLTALKASISTIRKQKTHESTHTKKGMYFYTRNKPGAEHRFHEFFKSELYQNPACDLKPLNALPTFLALPEMLADKTEVGDFSGLEELIKLAKDKQIQLALFAYPKHGLSMELDILCNNTLKIWQGFKQISQLLPANNSVKLWSFFDYNNYTTETINGKHPAFWQDPEHFNHEFGDQLLETMFSSQSIANSVGQQVSAQNIDSLYQRYKQQREQFLIENPHLLSELQQILHQELATQP